MYQVTWPSTCITHCRPWCTSWATPSGSPTPRSAPPSWHPSTRCRARLIHPWALSENNLLRRSHIIFMNWDSHTLKTKRDLRTSAVSEIAPIYLSIQCALPQGAGLTITPRATSPTWSWTRTTSWPSRSCTASTRTPTTPRSGWVARPAAVLNPPQPGSRPSGGGGRGSGNICSGKIDAIFMWVSNMKFKNCFSRTEDQSSYVFIGSEVCFCLLLT